MLTAVAAGIIASLAALVVKKVGDLTHWPMIVVTFALCFVAAVAVHALQAAGYWESFVRVLVTATTFYAVVIKSVQEVVGSQ